MPSAVPAVDLSVVDWSQQDVDLYNASPFYLAKMQVDRRKTWTTFNKFCGKIKWEPNKGNLMRLVRKVPSPHIRQFANPRLLESRPLSDMLDMREVTVDVKPRRHRFFSQVLNWVPNFRDFMTNHVDAQGKDIMEKMERFEDVFYRTNMYHQAPYVAICKAGGAIEVISAPYWDGTTNFTEDSDGKTTEWLKGVVIPRIGDTCTAQHLNLLSVYAEENLGVPPFSGSGLPSDNAGLTDKFCFVTSTEKWSQFVFDPWLKENKNINLDIVTAPFRGSFWGRITCKMEDKPLRFQADGTFPAPEVRVAGDDAYNTGDTVPNPIYADPSNTTTPADCSPYEIGHFIGRQGYDIIPVGPPPADFASDNPPDNFAAMFWNGEVKLTKKFLVPEEVAADGTVSRWEMNTFGEDLKFISQATYGIVGRERKFVIPVFYMRKRGQ